MNRSKGQYMADTVRGTSVAVATGIFLLIEAVTANGPFAAKTGRRDKDGLNPGSINRSKIFLYTREESMGEVLRLSIGDKEVWSAT